MADDDDFVGWPAVIAVLVMLALLAFAFVRSIGFLNDEPTDTTTTTALSINPVHQTGDCTTTHSST
ncbi:MAG TPA: hypothetical protein VGP90_03630 [Acidimicrobiia bacterium]|nr:hypothetical protein [Acidimicrobiia bacterium]